MPVCARVPDDDERLRARARAFKAAKHRQTTRTRLLSEFILISSCNNVLLPFSLQLLPTSNYFERNWRHFPFLARLLSFRSLCDLTTIPPAGSFKIRGRNPFFSAENRTITRYLKVANVFDPLSYVICCVLRPKDLGCSPRPESGKVLD